MSDEKQEYINLELPGIMGMGAVGPTLATMMAMLYSAVMVSIDKPPHWAYAGIMFLLSALLAVFPTAKAKLSMKLKVVMWPVATAIVFASAWGVNHGLSVGEEAISDDDNAVGWSMPSLVESAYAGTVVIEIHPSEVKDVRVNDVDFARVDHDTKTKELDSFAKKVKEGVWGYQTPLGRVYLKDKKGEWYAYNLKPEKRVEPPRQQGVAPSGGFFKRY